MLAHRDEEDASQQCASQSRFDNLLQTRLACLVPLQQGCNVEGQLCDGAKSGIYHSTNGKVTLGRDALDTQGGKYNVTTSGTRQNGHSAQVCSDPRKNTPGNPHTNIIGQGYDGADGDGELDVRAGKPVVFVNVSNNHGDDHQRKEV